eukprot:TRINITY_DN67886_c1_g1_i14.p1 TRINITY_DN67886_c1_g1~~TRINITY_DN67886_c1_g1_i14.p1  ORF type:complete len:593 (+),score=38.59 TRINITY_DN67886_c1_g1_i14:141-1919(+)
METENNMSGQGDNAPTGGNTNTAEDKGEKEKILGQLPAEVAQYINERLQEHMITEILSLKEYTATMWEKAFPKLGPMQQLQQLLEWNEAQLKSENGPAPKKMKVEHLRDVSAQVKYQAKGIVPTAAIDRSNVHSFVTAMPPDESFAVGFDVYRDIPPGMQKYFRQLPLDEVSSLDKDFFSSLIATPIYSRSEDSYHSLHDSLFARCFVFVMGQPAENYDRNVHDKTTTKAFKRPDFVAYWQQYPLFRGEEKNQTTADPEGEIQDKLQDGWKFGELPYAFAYTTNAAKIRLHLIAKSKQLQTLCSFDLLIQEQRIGAFFAVRNIYLICQYLSTCASAAGATEALRISKSNGVEVKEIGNAVKKTYPPKLRYRAYNAARVLHFATSKGCRHIPKVTASKFLAEYTSKFSADPSRNQSLEALVQANPRGTTLQFEPLGQARKPHDTEIRQAVLDLLETLTDLHANGILHRDIRWPNVIVHNSRWFLIDYDHAVVASDINQVPADQFSKELDPAGRAKELTQEMHSSFVDLYDFCMLLNELAILQHFSSTFVGTIATLRSNSNGFSGERVTASKLLELARQPTRSSGGPQTFAPHT